MVIDNSKVFLDQISLQEVVIWDETLRDGEQSPGVAFSIEQKIELATLMDEAGVGIIDIGFPVVSKEEQETVRTINQLGLNARTGVTIRAKKEDVDCALNCGVNYGFMFGPTSLLHIDVKFGMTQQQYKKNVLEAVKYALDSSMELCFIAEDTSRSDLQFIIPFFNELHELGVNKIIITDTVGIMVPTAMKRFTANILDNCSPGIRFGIHCHDDFGLAAANTLAAIEAGVVFPTVTVNGIGERAGNASLEEIVLALELIYKIKTGIDLKKIMPLSQMVERYSGLPVAPNKAVVGHNAFRHESGIHVHAMMKSLKTYETFSPEILGRKHEFILGKHSGRSLIRSIIGTQGKGDEKLEKMLIDKVKKIGNNRFKKEKMYRHISNYYHRELGMTEEEFKSLYREMQKDSNERLEKHQLPAWQQVPEDEKILLAMKWISKNTKARLK